MPHTLLELVCCCVIFTAKHYWFINNSEDQVPLVSSDKYIFMSCFFLILIHIHIFCPFEKNYGFSFSYLIDLVWTFSTMLNRLGESRHLRFVPDLKRFSSFITEYGCGFFTCGFYYIEIVSVYCCLVECFYHDRVLNFVKSFFYIYWNDHLINSRNKAHLIMMHNSFKMH